MTQRITPGFRLLLLIGAVIHTSTVHAQSNCDCSCEAYQAMQEMVQRMQAQAQSDQPRQVPPEMMQVAMCGQPCAQQWAQCAMGREPAPQAAAGQAAIDQERRIHEAQAANDEDRSHGDASPELTEDYLAGAWCSIYGGQETTQWQFHADGSYEIGMPAGNGWSMQPRGANLAAFQQRFERLVAMDKDRFVTEGRHGRLNVFNRGPC